MLALIIMFQILLFPINRATIKHNLNQMIKNAAAPILIFDQSYQLNSTLESEHLQLSPQPT